MSKATNKRNVPGLPPVEQGGGLRTWRDTRDYLLQQARLGNLGAHVETPIAVFNNEKNITCVYADEEGFCCAAGAMFTWEERQKIDENGWDGKGAENIMGEDYLNISARECMERFGMTADEMDEMQAAHDAAVRAGQNLEHALSEFFRATYEPWRKS